MSDAASFIAKWAASSGSERANYALFLVELTALLGVDGPQPTTGNPEIDAYTIDRRVTFPNTGTTGFIDCYKRGHFVLEAKQGGNRTQPTDPAQGLLLDLPPQGTAKGTATRGTRGWDKAMLGAKGQAETYARALPVSEGWPPFLVIVDVGHTIELYADFSRMGKNYTQFPDATRFRIQLDDLADPAIRDRLHKVWTDPYALDPARISARVTRTIAARLAALATSLEQQGHESERAARFLMRCLFSMFAEDVRLIPEKSFRDLLTDLRGQPQNVAPTLAALWQTMNTGGFSPVLRHTLLRFNGGLFADAEALPVNALQLGLLIDAAQADWREVEPAIFGTLLERALNARERHKLGAHYTPRAYVERLVQPTLMDPLREDWENAKAAAVRLADDGQMDQARAAVRTFHAQLCAVRVLDPACGSGNFLYVALEQMKRLEGEVIDLLAQLGERESSLSLEGLTVDPHQFLGIEVNPWAATVAELVLWIGYLQWHFRTHGRATPAEPVLRDFKNVECRDAVLDWSGTRPRLDDAGRPVTRWDGVTMTRHPVTGDDVPDPNARVAVLDYLKPRPATWPQADFIIGNPPFIGNKRMREALGDGYTEALRDAYPKIPQSADFVMFWWEKAALAARGWKPATEKTLAKGTRRFGLITTNSLTMIFNRKILEPHLADPKSPLSLIFAIPDHPWVDASDGAAVRIAITVGERGRAHGRLLTVVEESKTELEAEGRSVNFDVERGKIFANLTIGADVASSIALISNVNIGHMGVIRVGEGFVVNADWISQQKLLISNAHLIRPYMNGKELVAGFSNRLVIDTFGFEEQTLKQKFPRIFQHLSDTVKPEREAKSQNSPDYKKYAEEWWLFAKGRGEMREALKGLNRYIATVETAKHRIFSFLSSDILPDQKLRVLAVADAWILSIVSSRIHLVWSNLSGGTLEDRPVYNHSVCFDPFPFPDPDDATRAQLRDLGERLDAHRKRAQADHPGLTLTQMYNVLTALRAGTPLSEKERQIYDQGLVGILRQLHDDIDATVARAYGWPADLTDDAILHRLVALNRERAAEEAQGKIRWLRPDYQNPKGTARDTAQTAQMDLGTAPDAPADKPAWPKTLPDQMAGVRQALETLGTATPADIARQFKRARPATILPLLDTLATLGRARKLDGGTYAP